MKIILGSKSLSRNKILKQMGHEFTIMDPDIDEKAIRHEDPEQLVTTLAHAKAEALLPQINEEALLITSDQVVYCNNQIIEKPESIEEARYFLDLFTKFPTRTFTAILVTNTVNKQQFGGVDTAEIKIAPIPQDVIDMLVKKDYILHYAGGFSINDPLFIPYIEQIIGDPDSIRGLPKFLLNELLQKCNYSVII